MSGISNTTGNINSTSQTGFAAHRSSSTQSLVIGTTIICDVVEYNGGSGYNGTTGIFTAPVTGKYLFSAMVGVSGLANSTSDVYCQINLSNATGARFYTTRENSPLTTCGVNGSIILSLTSGDTAALVWGTISGTLQGDNSNVRNSYFAAVLVG
jgi:hypothetical protein